MSLITYRKTFNLGNFTSESIGVEMELNEGDNPVEALDACSQLVNEYHQKTIADLEEYRGVITKTIPDVQDIKIEKTIIQEMEECSTYAEIQSFRFTVKGEEEKVIYERKLSELSTK